MNLYWGDQTPQEASFFIYPTRPEMSLFKRIPSLPSPSTIPIQSCSFFPEKKQWCQGVNKALEAIRKGQIEKVVLARKAVFTSKKKIDPLSLLASLPSLGGTPFAFFNDTFAFLGVTPETLFSRRASTITSILMAGTRKRGLSQEEDTLFEQELLKSPKDRREWSLIQKHFDQTFPNSLSFSPPKIHKTAHVQHLYGEGVFTLENPSSDLALLEKIHPTPAVVGFPRKDALSLIRDIEPFERGFYTGVIGWNTQDACETKVMIRSSLVEENQISIFTGAGIVEGSDPDHEWEELNQKMLLFTSVFT